MNSSGNPMNLHIGRHDDGSWQIWTTVDGNRHVVSRHATREAAEHARATIPAAGRPPDA